MTTVAEAWTLITGHLQPLPDERIAIADATDRILAEPIRAERDQPPFDRVTMDGIAIASSAWLDGRRAFRIHAVQAAGQPAATCPSPDACIRVMTGAMRPEGTDAVIPIERVTLEGDEAKVEDAAMVEPGRFIHRQGSDRSEGEVVLEPGVRIGPAEMAVLASAGCASVAVRTLPCVAIVSTGDELVGVDATELAPWQIRSSNDLAIEASLRRANLARCSRTTLPDDPEQILAAVSALHDTNDMLILSGGVSMGDFDFVPAVLDKLDAKVVFHRIEQKPGRPMWFGLSGAGKPIFALPGNPVSTLVCTTRYVVPAFRQAAGLKPWDGEWVRLVAPVDAPSNLTYFLAVKLHRDVNGSEAEPRPTNSSGDFVSLAGTDGVVELPPRRERYPTNSVVRLFRW